MKIRSQKLSGEVLVSKYLRVVESQTYQQYVSSSIEIPHRPLLASHPPRLPDPWRSC